MEKNKLTTSTAEETVTISRTEYEDLLEQKRQNEWLLEQLRLARKKKFGSSSEQLTEEAYEQLSLLFDEPAAYKQPPEEEPEAEETVEVQAHSRKKRSGSAREILPENAEVEEETHELPEEARLCPQCGEVMQPIGKEVRETLKIIPAKVILHRDIYVTYGCDNCKQNDVSVPVMKTPQEPALIPGSCASAEAVAHIAVQKYVMWPDIPCRISGRHRRCGRGICGKSAAPGNRSLRSDRRWRLCRVASFFSSSGFSIIFVGLVNVRCGDAVLVPAFRTFPDIAVVVETGLVVQVGAAAVAPPVDTGKPLSQICRAPFSKRADNRK